MTQTNAQSPAKIEIFWDDQDPKEEGWYLRMTRQNGSEEGTCLDGDRDESLATLAQSAAPYVSEDVDPSTLSWTPMTEGLGWWVRV